MSFPLLNSPFCPMNHSMNIAEDILLHAAEQPISEEEALKRRMDEKSKEFVESGAEVYAKAC